MTRLSAPVAVLLLVCAAVSCTVHAVAAVSDAKAGLELLKGVSRPLLSAQKELGKVHSRERSLLTSQESKDDMLRLPAESCAFQLDMALHYLNSSLQVFSAEAKGTAGKVSAVGEAKYLLPYAASLVHRCQHAIPKGKQMKALRAHVRQFMSAIQSAMSALLPSDFDSPATTFDDKAFAPVRHPFASSEDQLDETNFELPSFDTSDFSWLDDLEAFHEEAWGGDSSSGPSASSSSSSSSSSISSSSRRKLRGGRRVKPTKTVAKDGSGNFRSIQAAVNAVGPGSVIYIKKGVYKEQVKITKANIRLVGDGASKTIISGSKSQNSGFDIITSATVGVSAPGFIAIGIKFENTAGLAGGQAVALRVDSDKASIWSSVITGHQDTLYASTGRQYYRGCMIEGTVDFIFGDSTTVIEKSFINAKDSPYGQTILASGRAWSGATTGLVISNSKVSSKGGTQIFLGRPWMEYSRMIVMRTYLPSQLQGAGWMTWVGSTWGGNPYLGEYANYGPGAAGRRASWAKPGKLSASTAAKFSSNAFIGLSSW